MILRRRAPFKKSSRSQFQVTDFLYYTGGLIELGTPAAAFPYIVPCSFTSLAVKWPSPPSCVVSMHVLILFPLLGTFQIYRLVFYPPLILIVFFSS